MKLNLVGGELAMWLCNSLHTLKPCLMYANYRRMMTRSLYPLILCATITR